MRRRAFARAAAGAALATPALLRQARAQAATVRIARQPGLPGLPLMVMERERLIERHAAAAGLPGVRAEWTPLPGPAAVAEAIGSGQADLGAAGVPLLAALWAKTVGTASEVLALCAIQSMPFVLVSGKPGVRSITDLAAGDRIAVPGVGVSAEAVLLRMAAAQQWGGTQWARLDGLMVAMPHPDAMAGLLAGTVDCHNAVAPFYQYELISRRLRRVLTSYDTFGGRHTGGVLMGTRRFRDDNPGLVQAVLAAQEDANGLIRRHPQQAAAIYLQATQDRGAEVPEMARLVADPEVDWTTTPVGVERLAGFMHSTGQLPTPPDSWQTLFMPEAHGLAGN